MKNTPTPWIAKGYEVRQDAGPYGGRVIADFGPHHTPPSEYPAQCRREDEANAAHAVKCVNEYGQLRARAEAAEALCAELRERLRAVVTTDHESKDSFIVRVASIIDEIPPDMGAELARLRAELVKSQLRWCAFV